MLARRYFHGLFEQYKYCCITVAGFISIVTAIAAIFAKRNTVQRTITNPATPDGVRMRLEDRWSGASLWGLVVSGFIRAGLVGVFSTIVVTFIINFFFAFQAFLHDMNSFARAGSYGQAMDVFSHMLSVMGQIFMLSNPLSLTLGIVVGVLLGIQAALSTGNRYMPGKLYSMYASSYPPPYPY